MKTAKYALGLDFGTNSVRALIVDVGNGEEVGTAIFPYPGGDAGILLDPKDANLARQNPAGWILGIEKSVTAALAAAKKKVKGFDPAAIVGIGVDTTGSTPLPLDRAGKPLALHKEFRKNLNAQAWLWKDHTAHAEAAEITALAAAEHPEYLAKCGGTYSSEWFWSKILHCLRTDPKVAAAAYSWAECADYIPALLTGSTDPLRMKRSRCAAGHKAMFNDAWGGLPAKAFLARLDPRLGELRDRLYQKTYTSDVPAGGLTKDWARKLGLRPGIAVAVGAFDAHLGGISSGVETGRFVKIIGTSTCDICVWPATKKLPDIPGLCGIVDGSVLPGYLGLEAGQSAVGDIFNWFVNVIEPGGPKKGSHAVLTKGAAALKPGESGLLALDWLNGNRTVLVDQRLTGLLVGLTLHSTPAEIYRALIEATAFGALTIIRRFEEYGVRISDVVNCGGIAEKNPLVMQIYADVTGLEMKIARSSQTCALGAAMAGAVAAGRPGGGHATFAEAQAAMGGIKRTVYKPDPARHRVYLELYALYRQLHDAFGTKDWSGSLFNVMKDLLAIKDRQRR
ncbi:MAG TPA: ribulokinase [Candidatus Aminicenantes bacterium]|nr:ribulokinase [Candidatus Aminicenantes bacterium]HRY63872.1 ribulokinase [Candidatus Aminicenantes bacterium]HRZ70785.1 ribulokinase [Candidatus Aminicenantes bacterium]